MNFLQGYSDQYDNLAHCNQGVCPTDSDLQPSHSLSISSGVMMEVCLLWKAKFNLFKGEKV